MDDSDRNLNPYQSPTSVTPVTSSAHVAKSLVYGVLGAGLGMFCFAQVVGCIGYYLGCFVHGFHQRPPEVYIMLGVVIGCLLGIVCGAIAGVQLRYGLRPRLLEVLVVCAINTVVFLGAVDHASDIALGARAIRLAFLGIAFGAIAGVILSVITRVRMPFM